MRTIHRTLTLCFAACLSGAPLLAQCQTTWQPGVPPCGPRAYRCNIGTAAWWDPDGPGPRQPLLATAGSFDIPALGAGVLATFDPASSEWGVLAVEPLGTVNAMVGMQNGDLVVGGAFASIGSQSIANLGVWNGSSWSALGGGIRGSSSQTAVLALQLLPNGDLVVAGDFDTVGTAPIAGLARWDGSQWHAFGAFQGQVQRLALRPNGNLVAAGTFLEPGTSNYCNIAEWDGSVWRTFGTGIQQPLVQITALAALANGDVAVGGLFATIGGVPIHGMARWDGSSWHDLGLTTSVATRPTLFLALPNGDLLLPNITPINRNLPWGVIRWDGARWTNYAPSPGGVTWLTTLPNGGLLAATSGGGSYLETWRGLARFDGAAWQPMSAGFDDTVRQLLPLPNGEVVAIGDFTVASATPVAGAARWTGQTWYPLSTPGNPLPWTTPTCGAIDAQGTLWLAGQASYSSVPAVLRASATGWQSYNGPRNVAALVVPPSQLPIVGCDIYPNYGTSVAQWNGSQWLALGATPDGPVHALLLRHNGDLIAGGEFLYAGGTRLSRIGRWDGTAWQPLGSGFDGPVRALAELPNGDLVAAGDFIMDDFGTTPLNLVARWDGSRWQAFGPGLAGASGASALALLALPQGDLLVGGRFTSAGGNAAMGIARWHGGAWQPVDGGVDGVVRALALRQDGEVVAGGTFAHAGANAGGSFAVLRSSCAPLAATYGTGCAGPAGALDLVTADLPWLGGAIRSVCYGVQPTGLGALLFGQQAAQLPLSSLHPAAGAGCLLLVQPLIAQLALPQQGAIAASFALPNDPLFLGLLLRQQVLVGDLGPSGALQTLASSNGLALTIGAF